MRGVNATTRSVITFSANVLRRDEASSWNMSQVAIAGYGGVVIAKALHGW